MMIGIPDVLTGAEAAQLRERLGQATWPDGGRTAGRVAARVKHNCQLADDDPLGTELGGLIAERLGRHPRFIAAALPLKMLPPRFNRYEGGGHYGLHIDSAILTEPRSGERIRGDLSATLFLSDPEFYDGGELVTGDGLARQRIRLPAGHLLLYPADTLHEVMPVTRGVRYAAFFWIQSLVPDPIRRQRLLELDESIQSLAADVPDHPGIARLTGLYHNLLREWAQT